MDNFAELCREMAKQKHIMSFSDIGVALSTGAAAGKKSNIVGGVAIGAILGLSAEASIRVVAISKELLTDGKCGPILKPKA